MKLNPLFSNTHGFITLLLIWIGVAPLYLQPMRAEPHEPARAAFFGVIALVLWLAIWVNRAYKPPRILWIFAPYIALLLLSGALALSPSTAFFGDFVRRYGVLTQLALLVLILAGDWVRTHYNGQVIARLLWLAGLLVSLMAFLQQFRLYPTNSASLDPLRSSSLIGYPTYLSGWIALCVIVCVVYAPRQLRDWKTWIWWAGVGFIASAMLPSGSRAAVLALVGGLGTLLLVFAAIYRWRAVFLVLLALGLAVSLTLPELIGTQNIPLLERLALSISDDLRVIMWERGSETVARFPTMMSVQQIPDLFADARIWIGYGAESQDVLYEQFPRVYDLIIDRAHNYWLDVLLTGGWLGFITRVGLFAVGIGWALKRLGLLSGWVMVPMLASMGMVGALSYNMVWLPMLVTLAALGGLWVGLCLMIFFRRQAPHNPPARDALLLLGVLWTFMIDMQFGFETVSVVYLLAFCVGFSLRPHTQDAPVQTTPESANPLLWVGFAGLGGASVLRALFYNAPNPQAVNTIVALCIALLALSVLYIIWLDGSRFSWRQALGGGLFVGLCWVFGIWGESLQATALILVWELVFLVGSTLILWGMMRTQNTTRAALWRWGIAVPVFVLGLGVFALDTSADIALRRGFVFTPSYPLTDALKEGAALRFWDARAQAHYGLRLISAAEAATDQAAQDAAYVDARAAFERALKLHPYEVLVAHRIPSLPLRQITQHPAHSALSVALNVAVDGAPCETETTATLPDSVATCGAALQSNE